MQVQTQASLNKSQAFLGDCVELAHLQLKQRLEALKRGETIDWKETREIVREGRTAARQLAQIASLELRDRQQEGRKAPRAVRGQTRPMPAPKVPLTKDMAVRFVSGVMEWQNASMAQGEAAPLPEAVVKVMNEVGLDPADQNNIEVLMEMFESSMAKAMAA